jgi:flagellum-specific peptidoglycan hydrolase FlgJ
MNSRALIAFALIAFGLMGATAGIPAAAFAALPANRRKFLETYGAQIKAASQGTGIFPSIKAAQLILESGWGASWLFNNANNGFGIKAFGGWTGPKVFRRDNAEGSNDPYRIYSSVAAGIRDHTRFLQENPRYTTNNVFRSRTPQEQAWNLQKAGYATNPNYANTLIAVIRDNNLTALDA